MTALERLATFPAEIVLLDIGLPRLNGYEVARQIRERFGEAPVRLYALTGYGNEKERAQAAQAGFDTHLTKPVDPAHLLNLIASDFNRNPGIVCQQVVPKPVHIPISPSS